MDFTLLAVILANNVSSIGPALKCFFIQAISVKVTALVCVWINMTVAIKSTSNFNSFVEYVVAMLSTGCRIQFF